MDHKKIKLHSSKLVGQKKAGVVSKYDFCYRMVADGDLIKISRIGLPNNKYKFTTSKLPHNVK